MLDKLNAFICESCQKAFSYDDHDPRVEDAEICRKCGDELRKRLQEAPPDA